MIVTGREAKTLLERAASDPEIGRFAARLHQKIEQFEASIPLWRRRLRRQAIAVPFAQPALVVQALGGTHVKLDGKVIGCPEWKSRLASDMLFLLLAHPQGLTKEEIGVFFWPDSPPSKMKLNFEKTIYRLRVALTRDVVVFDEQDDRYYFNWDLDYRYDVGAFQTRLAEAQQADNPAEAIARYEKALEIYQGHYLPDLEGMWVLQQREVLSHSYREAVINLATLCLEQGDYQPGLRHCAALLAEDPYLETAHRLVMRIHAAQGNLADVARQFTNCKDVLQDELQISPSDQTIQLYASLVQNRKEPTYLN
jgi:DNA-binding SARP family transcriptional activator